ncbi:hypothetical protein NM688_g6315 [Phlebia brevispora]|uniref:Uncharacterized protein n=1 Tax=Phlebia brevispora TaxID=194682 RepID=A0ACC1SH76_9APHY|nr:hypothetical protein NM688_g6315 [Phlebia brevispora]
MENLRYWMIGTRTSSGAIRKVSVVEMEDEDGRKRLEQLGLAVYTKDIPLPIFENREPSHVHVHPTPSLSDSATTSTARSTISTPIAFPEGMHYDNAIQACAPDTGTHPPGLQHRRRLQAFTISSQPMSSARYVSDCSLSIHLKEYYLHSIKQ